MLMEKTEMPEDNKIPLTPEQIAELARAHPIPENLDPPTPHKGMTKNDVEAFKAQFSCLEKCIGRGDTLRTATFLVIFIASLIMLYAMRDNVHFEKLLTFFCVWGGYLMAKGL